GGVAGRARGGAGGGATGGASGAAGTAAGGAAGSALPPVFVSYPCDQTAGPALNDASGNGRGGALEGTASFDAGVIGNALVLDGAAGTYVRLPAGLLATLRDTTIAFWVRPRAKASAANAWQRVFDFGADTTSYMFFTSYSDDNKLAHFGITVTGNKNEQGLNATAPLPGGTWTHVAIVLGPAGGALYMNGVVAQTNAALKLRPADLGMTVNDWLGRSQFTGDPNFDGEIDQLLIYAAALTPEQVAALFQQR
ncbi:MAG TPA: LamG domain-containing protein, partial [Polyangia bacterium]|nr:LamG domain-containing protein [Polyangia bacterium]